MTWFGREITGDQWIAESFFDYELDERGAQDELFSAWRTFLR